MSFHPYILRLREENYFTSGEEPSAGFVQVTQPCATPGSVARTIAGSTFSHPAVSDRDEQRRIRARDAEHLLRLTNRLLRWYRAVSGQAEVIELTRAQASPFQFEVIGHTESVGWDDPLEFEAAGSRPLSRSLDELSVEVRRGLSSGNEPLVERLFLIDAERALH